MVTEATWRRRTNQTAQSSSVSSCKCKRSKGQYIKKKAQRTEEKTVNISPLPAIFYDKLANVVASAAAKPFGRIGSLRANGAAAMSR